MSVLRTRGASLARVLLAVVVSLALVLGWALADMPQLYARSFYADGGVLRAIQLVCTDVLGPRGVVAVGLGLALVLVGTKVRPFLAKLRRVRMSAPALLAILGVGHEAPRTATDDRPNILVLAADSLRADRIDPHVMPNLARLAAESTRFDRAYVSLPHPRSSTAMLETVAARLGHEGYRTAAVSDPSDPAAPGPPLPLLVALGAHLGRSLFPELREITIADPDFVADDVVASIDRLAGRPFFVSASFASPHPPHASPAPYYGRFTDRAYRGRFKYDAPPDDARVDDADRAQIVGLHDGASSAVDDAVGRILAALAARHLDRRTIVVVTGVRGTALHVPLVIHDPRLATSQVSTQIARDVDLLPTLLELGGLEPGPDDGRSLVPALRGELLAPRLAYGAKELRASSPLAEQRTIRDERWKLVYLPDRAGVRYQLFDTEHDPDETTDVAAGHPAEVTRLTAAMWRWMLEDAGMAERDGYLVPRDTAAPYDVLWMVVDGLRPDAPALDELARRGARFTSAYAAGPGTAAMLAGARASEPGTELLPAVLGRHGVTTSIFANDVDAARLLAANQDTRFFMFVRLRSPQAIGGIMQALDDARRRERTIVIVTGDHGEAMSEATTHVPILVVGPGFAPDSVIAARCQTTDLAPTVLDLLGLEPPPGMSGRSLLRLPLEAEPRVIVTEGHSARTVLHGRWRLIVREGASGELYDLATDPGEHDDVARKHPEIVAELRARLAAALANVPAADARPGGELHPPVTRLRFAGGAVPHRITGTIHAKDAALTPVALGSDAFHQEGDRIDVAFRTDPTTMVGFDLGAGTATWDFWLDDEPLHDVFGGPYGLRAPALEHGVMTEDARTVARAPALPIVDPRHDRGLFVVRAPVR